MSDEEGINVEFVDLTFTTNETKAEKLAHGDEEGETIAYHIARYVMKEFEPGFVIIGSPNMVIAPSGLLYPEQIGIVMNDGVGITKTVLANILDEVAAQLGDDMAKLQDFVNRTTKND